MPPERNADDYGRDARFIADTLDRHEEWLRSIERRRDEDQRERAKAETEAKVAAAVLTTKMALIAALASMVASGLIGAAIKWGFR